LSDVIVRSTFYRIQKAFHYLQNSDKFLNIFSVAFLFQRVEDVAGSAMGLAYCKSLCTSSKAKNSTVNGVNPHSHGSQPQASTLELSTLQNAMVEQGEKLLDFM
jgi:hypothetical protein